MVRMKMMQPDGLKLADKSYQELVRDILAGEPIITPQTLHAFLGGNHADYCDETESLLIDDLEANGYRRELVMASPFSAPEYQWVRDEEWPEDEHWKRVEAKLEAAQAKRIAGYLDMLGI